MVLDLVMGTRESGSEVNLMIRHYLSIRLSPL